MWEITDRGFLPTADPIKTLVSNKEYHYGQAGCDPYITRLEHIPSHIPQWIEGRKLREELVHAIKEVTPYMVGRNFDYVLDRTPNEEYLERLMHLFTYMASSYVYARYENPATRIPSEIAIPLVKIAEKLDRKPILSYASYCLTNWERMDLNEPIKLDNISLLSNFCAREVGKADEDWFILVHVDIEQAAADGVSACKQLLENPWRDEVANIVTANDMLTKIFVSLAKMNKTLKKMPEQCSPDNYFRWVRPYIFSFNNVVYEGCFDNKPQTFRGETGAQSSIIPAFLSALGVKHQDSMLTHHLAEMRDYMPAPHRRFLQNLEGLAANNQEISLRSLSQRDPVLRDIYNECVNEIISFRNLHFEFAVNYIQKKVENPAGTGGTPYVPWLKQLREETEAHLLP